MAPITASSASRNPSTSNISTHAQIPPVESKMGVEDENPNLSNQMEKTNDNGIMTTTATCRCWKICKNSQGLKIHQTGMKCLQKVTYHSTWVPYLKDAGGARSGITPQSQIVHVTQPFLPNLFQGKAWIKWPQASNTTVWEQFHEDVNKVEVSVEQSLHAMATNISSLAQERFSAEKKSPQTTCTKNQMAVKFHKIQQELQSLKRQYKEANEEQCHPLGELRSILSNRLMTLSKAWTRASMCNLFSADPFDFTKLLLG